MHPKTTPKDFFLWAGAVVALYWSVIAFIFLIFDYINYGLPNPLTHYPDPYQSGIPYEMASVIILFPLYACISWIIRRNIIKDPTRADIWVRRWAIILTLFIAGLAATIDLVILLTTFLRGDEITLAFMLKVLVVLLVAAGVFMHSIADLWGYWAREAHKARYVRVAAVILVMVTIVSGFFIVGTPWQARLSRFDDQKVQDLQTIQYQVVNYWQHKQALPKSLADVKDPLSEIKTPVDPQTGASYEYQATGKTSFELCATFNAQSRGQAGVSVPEPVGLGGPGMSENWQHGAGRICFSRTIDPQLYPPIKSIQQ